MDESFLGIRSETISNTHCEFTQAKKLKNGTKVQTSITKFNSLA